MKNKLFKIFFLIIILNLLIVSNIYALSPESELIYEGIDVSSWQGYIDYEQVKNSGIEVVYIKASEGISLVDDYLNYNYEHAKANGLKIGFYHFLTATTVADAEAQAYFFASVISGKEVDCKLAMDYEEFYGVGNYEINQIAVAFMRKLKQITGKDVIVYSDLYNADHTFNASVSSNGPLWIAYYNNEIDFYSHSTWDKYIGIQYTDIGEIPGISGHVDRDKYTKEILLEYTNEDTSNNSSSGTGNDKDKKNIHYIVKKGDTLTKIANKYNTTVASIVALNGIINPNLIYPGQVLKIPINSNPSQQTTPEMPEQNDDSLTEITYTIKRGDCLWTISRRYGVSVQDLVKWNNIKNPRLIYAGSILKIYTNKAETSNSSGSGVYMYTVKRGDCLWLIARRYGTTVRKLAYDNNIKNPRLIYPGQVLKIY